MDLPSTGSGNRRELFLPVPRKIGNIAERCHYVNQRDDPIEKDARRRCIADRVSVSLSDESGLISSNVYGSPAIVCSFPLCHRNGDRAATPKEAFAGCQTAFAEKRVSSAPSPAYHRAMRLFYPGQLALSLMCILVEALFLMSRFDIIRIGWPVVFIAAGLDQIHRWATVKEDK